MCALMLVSREKGRFKEIDGTKTSLGQFQTRAPTWLASQVLEFIKNRAPAVLYDPFAGHGELLRAAQRQLPAKIRGLDIDPTTKWPTNDSLRHISPLDRALIVTNPPYLAKHSAKRKGVHAAVAGHFDKRNDLYQLALDRCQEACPHVVAIVPETIINSDYPKTHFVSITILEENLFNDTDCPVCVVCIDRSRKADKNGPLIYVGDKRIGRLADLERARLHPRNDIRIDFNIKSGRIALRAVDLPNPAKPIAFMRREDSDYPVERIKVSSRLVTFLEIPSLLDAQIGHVIGEANRLLAEFRQKTADIALSPFKGNTKLGRRRRRLDYYTARAILEQAIAIAGETTQG